jgi:hypothetical protein
MGGPQLERIQAAIDEGSADVNIFSPKDVKMSRAELKGSNNYRGEIPVTVSGWVNSAASNNADGGVSSLTIWLERKSAEKGAAPLKLKTVSIIF